MSSVSSATSSPDPTDSAPAGTTSTLVGGARRAPVIVALVVALIMINWADKSALGLVAVPVMEDLGISPQQFGLLGSAYFFTYSASAILFGWIATRVRVNRILLVIALLWVAFMLPVAFLPSFAILFLSRLGLGFSEAPATPLGNFIVQSWYPDSRRTIPATLVMVGSPLGVLLAGPGLTFLMLRLGWESIFATMAVIGLVWCLAWAFVGGEGAYSGRAGVRGGTARTTWRETLTAFGTLLSRRSWVFCTIVTFAAYWTITLSTTWMAAFFTKGLGFSKATTGSLLAVSPAISIVLMLVWGGASALLIRRGVSTRWSRGFLIGATSAAGGLFVVLGSLVGNIGTVVVLVAIGAALCQPIFPIGFLLVAEVAPPKVRALSISLFAALSTLAGIIAPAVTGALVGAGGADGYRTSFLLAGLISLVAGLLGVVTINPARDLARDAARAAT